MHIRTNLKPATIFALILVVFAFLVQIIVYLLDYVCISLHLSSPYFLLVFESTFYSVVSLLTLLAF